MPNSSPHLNRRRLLGLSATTALTATGLLPATRTLAGPATATPTAPAGRLDAAVTRTMNALAIPGASVLIDRPDAGVWTAGFGLSDLQRRTPMKPDMHMRIGSITKTMTATVVLQLVDEGAFTLDSILVDLLPAASIIPNAERITVRQLLDMTSGIFNIVDGPFLLQVTADPLRVWTPEEMIAIAAKHDPVFAPGTDFDYSDTNYLLLGMIIEQVAGHPIAAELERRLFVPLKMSQTSLPATPELPAPFAHGYGLDPSALAPSAATPVVQGITVSWHGIPFRDWTLLHPSVAGAAGGVVSTVGDVHRWLRAFIDGSLISEALQRERMTFRPVKRDPGEPPYGYGLGIANYDGMIGHDGSILGYQSFAGHRRQTETSIVVLTNREPRKDGTDSADEIARALDHVLTV